MSRTLAAKTSPLSNCLALACLAFATCAEKGATDGSTSEAGAGAGASAGMDGGVAAGAGRGGNAPNGGGAGAAGGSGVGTGGTAGAEAGEGGEAGSGGAGGAAGTGGTAGTGGSGAGTGGSGAGTGGDEGSAGTGGSGGMGGAAGAAGAAGTAGSSAVNGCDDDLLFAELFEDSDFAARGWYDGPAGDLSSDEHIPDSSASFECRFEQRATGCSGGTPGRYPFAETETLCVSYWVKYSANFVGSNRSYHPHEFYFVTNQDDRWVGPANSHLTAYIEQVGGVPRLALQDSRNVDNGCILLNNDNFVGCGGDFDTYLFTENRSVCACNGLAGDLDGRDCFDNGGYYYSARFWDAPSQMFTDEPGTDYKNDWHLVEAYFEMNTIHDGVGVADGRIRYFYDGRLVISYDHILMRTGQHPNMRFNQFMIGPYIGDGSPVDQTMWVDALRVSRGMR